MERAKAPYVSADECAWFKLVNYNGLRQAPLSDWVHLVEDRVRLQTMLSVGDAELFSTLFPRIQNAPKSPLGFGQKSNRRPHSTDTATVQPLAYGQLRMLESIASHRQALAQDTFDGSAPPDRSDGLACYAHLRVNLQATDAQLKADFAKWLQSWRGENGTVTRRKYQSAVKSWAKNKLIPYMDLHLFAAAQEKRIAPLTYAELLDLGHTYDSSLKALQASALVVFNDATLQALRLAAL